MPKPRLTAAVTWASFEQAVLAVFEDALGQLTLYSRLPRAEEPINLELYWLLRKSHLSLLQAKTKGMMPFTILFDSTSQPEPDDVTRAQRLQKRPDFDCVLMNPQALDHRASQINYYVECKRLGNPVATWVLNDNYTNHGIERFVNAEWEYAKGYRSAAMVGYLESSTGSTVLNEVNTQAAAKGVPSLTLAAGAWVVKGITPLSQTAMKRSFHPSPFTLHHLWVDLCHWKFVTPKQTPPLAAALLPSPRKAAKLAPTKKTSSTSPRKKKQAP